MTANSVTEIGSLLFNGIDQIDLTGPFEVLSRLPNARHRIYGVHADPVRDIMGLVLTPDATIDDAPQLDVLHVPGGPGQELLMQDERVSRGFVSKRAGQNASSPSAREPFSWGRRDF